MPTAVLRKDLGPSETPGSFGGRLAHDQRCSGQCQQQAGGIGEHVGGVDEQGQTSWSDRADDLGDQDGEGDPEGPGKFAAIGRRRSVIVVVSHLVARPRRSFRP